MPKFLQSIVTVIEVFYQYATKDEECDTLNKAEMKEFLENEFYQIMKVRTPHQDWKQPQFPSTCLPFVTCQTLRGLSLLGNREQGLVKTWNKVKSWLIMVFITWLREVIKKKKK